VEGSELEFRGGSDCGRFFLAVHQDEERHLTVVLGSAPDVLSAADGRIDGDIAVDPNNPDPISPA